MNLYNLYISVLLVFFIHFNAAFAQDTTQIKGVIIEANQNKISLLKAQNITTITTGDLQKAACCNLSESFEQNASVSITMADGATGATKLSFLGLDGVYTQILAENMPTLRGIATGYGLGYVPGSWLHSIQISKGIGTVANGYEGNVGSINMEFLKPENAPRFFVNAFVAHTGRAELNTHYTQYQPKNKRWSSMNLLHLEAQMRQNDNNTDGFLDDPMQRQIHFFQRWKYNGKTIKGQFGIRALIENRAAGQFKNDISEPYKIQINTQRTEVFGKIGKIYTNAPYKSWGIIQNITYHRQQSVYNIRAYNVGQWSYYGNFVYQNIINNTTNHTYKLGANVLLDNYNQNINSTELQLINVKINNASVGFYNEYTYTPNFRWDIVAGARLDYIQNFGVMPTPRLHIKYNPSENIAIRASGGRAFRWAQPLIENQNFLVSNRRITTDAPQFAEVSWNYGVNYTQVIKLRNNHEMTLNFDAYRTQFERQMIVDFESPKNVSFYTLYNQSYANSLQAEATATLFKNTDIKLAYKFEDTRIKYTSDASVYKLKPLLPQHTALFTLHTATKYDKWQLNYTTRWVSAKRLPLYAGEVEIVEKPKKSPSFFIHNIQITRRFAAVEWYAGSENLFNFSIGHSIHLPYATFASGFDASTTWGPVMGRRVYAGVRYTVK